MNIARGIPFIIRFPLFGSSFKDPLNDRGYGNAKGKVRRAGKHPKAPRNGGEPKSPRPIEQKAQKISTPHGKAQHKADHAQQNKRAPVLALVPDPFEKFFRFFVR